MIIPANLPGEEESVSSRRGLTFRLGQKSSHLSESAVWRLIWHSSQWRGERDTSKGAINGTVPDDEMEDVCVAGGGGGGWGKWQEAQA